MEPENGSAVISVPIDSASVSSKSIPKRGFRTRTDCVRAYTNDSILERARHSALAVLEKKIEAACRNTTPHVIAQSDELSRGIPCNPKHQSVEFIQIVKPIPFLA
jgi:hypothetical protein